eukprot:TRINITY_DN10119_c0_g1_i1.p1 TRINITY_DN10119_c0_g1~~TRINITY_DN10119_c0_g1_i1.p1  ORF type:complete len:522 (-),score=156.53 TRINITY_DN10119_c0_g1_i1:102-1610(-)
MTMPAERLGTSKSEASMNSKMSESRRAKLMDLKNREALKDMLTEKFIGRFGHGGTKGDDECSVASGTIRREVEQFTSKAVTSEGNLIRLERRLKGHARGHGNDEGSMVSGVSAYTGLTGLSRLSHGSRSATSVAGQSVVQGTRKNDWSTLDEYASYLNEQDVLRQKLGVQALQRKLRMDLDQQVKEKDKKKEADREEEARYYQNTLAEMERWKQQEQVRAEELQQKIKREQKDREEQLQYDRKVKEAQERKAKQEETALVGRIITEMEADQRRFHKSKEQTKKAMRKVFEENMDDRRKKLAEEQDAKDREAATMKEYNRILDEQEAQRAEEMAQRMERQATLMKKLQETTAGAKKSSGDNDAKRAAAQREESDRHYFEAEAVKKNRLKQMRLENQAYLFKQLEEKEARKADDQYLNNIQAEILVRDTNEYHAKEKQKAEDKRKRSVAHRKEIEQQMEQRAAMYVPDMDKRELDLNKPLLSLVHRTLDARDANAILTSVPEEE